MNSKEITDADFVNLANKLVGSGLLQTGFANHKLATEYAKQECMGLIEFMYASCAETVPYSRPAKWKIDLGTEVTFEELLQLYEQSK